MHLPEKHFPEITFPRKTLGRSYIISNVHFPKSALARNYISMNGHLPEITFPQTCTCYELRFPDNLFSRNYCTLARKFIWRKLFFQELIFPPKLIFSEFTLARIYI